MLSRYCIWINFVFFLREDNYTTTLVQSIITWNPRESFRSAHLSTKSSTISFSTVFRSVGRQTTRLVGSGSSKRSTNFLSYLNTRIVIIAFLLRDPQIFGSLFFRYSPDIFGIPFVQAFRSLIVAKPLSFQLS